MRRTVGMVSRLQRLIPCRHLVRTHERSSEKNLTNGFPTLNDVHSLFACRYHPFLECPGLTPVVDMNSPNTHQSRAVTCGADARRLYTCQVNGTSATWTVTQDCLVSRQSRSLELSFSLCLGLLHKGLATFRMISPLLLSSSCLENANKTPVLKLAFVLTSAWRRARTPISPAVQVATLARSPPSGRTGSQTATEWYPETAISFRVFCVQYAILYIFPSTFILIYLSLSLSSERCASSQHFILARCAAAGL